MDQTKPTSHGKIGNQGSQITGATTMKTVWRQITSKYKWDIESDSGQLYPQIKHLSENTFGPGVTSGLM